MRGCRDPIEWLSLDRDPGAAAELNSRSLARLLCTRTSHSNKSYRTSGEHTPELSRDPARATAASSYPAFLKPPGDPSPILHDQCAFSRLLRDREPRSPGVSAITDRARIRRNGRTIILMPYSVLLSADTTLLAGTRPTYPIGVGTSRRSSGGVGWQNELDLLSDAHVILAMPSAPQVGAGTNKASEPGTRSPEPGRMWQYPSIINPVPLNRDIQSQADKQPATPSFRALVTAIEAKQMRRPRGRRLLKRSSGIRGFQAALDNSKARPSRRSRTMSLGWRRSITTAVALRRRDLISLRPPLKAASGAQGAMSAGVP